jgi:hypothetical protein
MGLSFKSNSVVDASNRALPSDKSSFRMLPRLLSLIVLMEFLKASIALTVFCS